MPREVNGGSSNQSAEKLLLILEALANESQPVKLVDFARQIRMNPSTLYRFLTALQKAGYAVQQSDGRYALSLKLCYLAGLVQKHSRLTSDLHGAVVEAEELFQESAHLAREENGKIIYIDNVTAASQSLTIRQYIGKTAPMHCTGVGKLLLLEYSEAQLDQLIAEQGLPRYTEHTLTTKKALCGELDRIRAQGYAFDNEECELGVRCVAVPLRDYTGKIVAGLSISGPTSRITDQVVAEKLPALLEIAQRASASWGA